MYTSSSLVENQATRQMDTDGLIRIGLWYASSFW